MVEPFALIVFGLLVSVTGLVLLSYTLNVPYPIFLVLGGLALSFVPDIPKLELEPELVLLIFLPVLLFSTLRRSSPRCASCRLTRDPEGCFRSAWSCSRRSS